jgi:peptide/nickel transport system substrate-binding protein
MKKARVAKVALGGIAAAALAFSLLAPAQAAARSTVIAVESNSLTGLNPSVRGQNLLTNSNVSYLTGMGFWYYNDKSEIVRNPVLGSFKIVKDTAKDFRSEWRLNKGLVWSDGTPITAHDLLLTHAICSNKFSIDRGLGDPGAGATKFNALCYSGLYDRANSGAPIISSDALAVTHRFNYQIPDWELYGPGIFPVHALVNLAQGKTKLGTVAENNKAKDAFLKAFQGKNSDLLTKMAEIWSTAYNIKEVNKSTNPNLLVRNGPYLIDSIVPDQSVTMKLNPKYNTGPKTSGIKTIIIRTLAETAAPQALANKEIDIYAGQPTADGVAQLKTFAGVKVVGSSQAIYEHIDLRTGGGTGIDDEYRGVFATSNNKARNDRARDLRTAFLLAYPRDEIVDKLVKPINANAQRLDSLFFFPNEPSYKTVTQNSGVSKYTKGTQAARTAEALALVKKHFPEATATNPVVDVKLHWGAPANLRRANSAALVIAELGKAGFKVASPGDAAWSTKLGSVENDAQYFAWVKSSTSLVSTVAIYRTGGGNNYSGWSNAVLDEAVSGFEKKATDKQKAAFASKAEKVLVDEAYSLGIFQHPGVTAFNNKLKNVKPAPLSPNHYWNFWEWKY